VFLPPLITSSELAKRRESSCHRGKKGGGGTWSRQLPHLWKREESLHFVSFLYHTMVPKAGLVPNGSHSGRTGSCTLGLQVSTVGETELIVREDFK
jgi:hypothetical protein